MMSSSTTLGCYMLACPIALKATAKVSTLSVALKVQRDILEAIIHSKLKIHPQLVGILLTDRHTQW